MKTNTVTISVFPTYKEISTPVYLGGISHQEIFENVFVSESYEQDRENLESTVTKLIDAGLNGIKGRSAAKTKLQKINFLLEHGCGYYFNSEGKISRKGSEQSAEYDFYGNTTPPATQPATPIAVKPIAVKPRSQTTQPATPIAVKPRSQTTQPATPIAVKPRSQSTQPAVKSAAETAGIILKVCH